ncbi:MAG: GMP reductase [Treponema sp.]|nr:GMP reductase [Treponema sp.]
MKIRDGVKISFADVLIEPKRSILESRQDAELIRRFKTKHGAEFKGIPIIAANMATGNFNMLKEFIKYKMFVAIAKHHNEEWRHIEGREGVIDYFKYGFYTIGMSDYELKELIQFNSGLSGILQPYLKICVDIANGYTQRFADFVREVRQKFPANVIIAGNVCTPEMVQELILAGADFIKVGIGPGSVCTTRQKTGVGYPQISASLNCAEVAHGLDAGIVLDGGMTCPGDIAKAFCANTDMVMVGGMFAGTDECDGELITKYIHSGEYKKETENVSNHGLFTPIVEEKTYKRFYGMSSAYANSKHSGGLKDYRTSEGGVEEIECKGPVKTIIEDILGGLRSACTYIGSSSIKNMGKCGTFIRVYNQKDSPFTQDKMNI